ncbi:histone deacetylase [Yinghuangia aomiensis]
MRRARLDCYLQGGIPPGGQWDHPGSRDTRPPRAVRPYELPGGLYFAVESRVWTGGIAFYDPDLPGTAPGRAYLVSRRQLSDIISQELYTAGGPALNGLPDRDYDFGPVLATKWHALGEGAYETLVYIGDLDGHPALTFTGPHRATEAVPTKPSGRYLVMLVQGLEEAHRWPSATAAEYLCSLPGAEGEWTPEQVLALMR